LISILFIQLSLSVDPAPFTEFQLQTICDFCFDNTLKFIKISVREGCFTDQLYFLLTGCQIHLYSYLKLQVDAALVI